MAESQSAKAARIRAGKAAPASDRAVTVADNQTPEQKAEAARLDEEAQVVSIITRVKAKREVAATKKAKLDAARQEHKESLDAVTVVFKEAALLGYKRNALEELYGAIHEQGVRRNQQAEEERRARWRKFYNLPVADSRQQELEAKLPEAEKNATDFEAEGYKAGLSSEERKAPAAAVKAGHDQRWLAGFDAGTARKAWSLTAAKAIPLPGAKPTASAAPPAETPGEAV